MKAFDAEANGYVRAEGLGVVILKPIKAAKACSDCIYAVVKGSGINQDVFTPEGLTVPSESAQAALLDTVYRRAGVNPLDVDFVEAHGTGTVVGDPHGGTGLRFGSWGRSTRKKLLFLLGSVKTNLGHLEGTAGLAGLIKGVLVASHGLFHR